MTKEEILTTINAIYTDLSRGKTVKAGEMCITGACYIDGELCGITSATRWVDDTFSLHGIKIDGNKIRSFFSMEDNVETIYQPPIVPKRNAVSTTENQENKKGNDRLCAFVDRSSLYRLDCHCFAFWQSHQEFPVGFSGQS